MSAYHRAQVLSSHVCSAPASQSGVLDGVRVVELATVVAAPSACAILCDFGAEVIKVEAPEGDMFRQEGLALQRGRNHSSMFDNCNRGKKSVVVDVKDPSQLARLHALIDTADVFVTNVRNEALKRLSLDFESMRTKYPSLVYAHLTAFGQTGPDADLPGYDVGELCPCMPVALKGHTDVTTRAPFVTLASSCRHTGSRLPVTACRGLLGCLWHPGPSSSLRVSRDTSLCRRFW